MIWLKAADNFEKTKKKVKPLEDALADAKSKLEIVEADLAQAEGKLSEVQ